MTSGTPPRGPDGGARIGRDGPWIAGHDPSAGHGKDPVPNRVYTGQRLFLLRGGSKISNLGRHQPMDLQNPTISPYVTG